VIRETGRCDARSTIASSRTRAVLATLGSGRPVTAPISLVTVASYAATTHFNGQRTLALDGDRATGESYCLAHHLSNGRDGQRTMMIAAIRYLDTFVKLDGGWLFAERRLMVDWTETRESVS
jgi:hypothetical protein